MKSKQLLFFVLSEDIGVVLNKIEEVFMIKYYKLGLFDSEQIPVYDSFLSFPDFGYTKYGDWNFIDAYLLVPFNYTLHVRQVPQRSGGIKYAVDQMENAESIELKIGGIFLEKGGVIVAGRMATISRSTFSEKLFHAFSSEIKREFKKIGNFYVGKKAEEKLKEGWRLITNERMPKEYDLKIA